MSHYYCLILTEHPPTYDQVSSIMDEISYKWDYWSCGDSVNEQNLDTRSLSTCDPETPFGFYFNEEWHFIQHPNPFFGSAELSSVPVRFGPPDPPWTLTIGGDDKVSVSNSPVPYMLYNPFYLQAFTIAKVKLLALPSAYATYIDYHN